MTDILKIRVTPKASSNRVKADGDILRVYVTCAPEDGRANKAVIDLLSDHLGIPKSRLEIIRGMTGRDKTVRILPV